MTPATREGLVSRARRVVAGTPFERPARAVAQRLRRVLYGTVDAPPAAPDPVPSSGDEVPMFVPPGHFYSPVPSRADIEAFRIRSREPRPETLPAIDLRLDAQAALLDSFGAVYADQPFPLERSDETRYWFENHSFSYGDALALHCMLRTVRPRRVVEVGSGWSSCVLLDTCERFLDWEPDVTLIEPYPHQLHLLLRPGDLDRVRLVPEPVQQVPLSQFEVLERDDFLFIDSTHVARVGSDVNREVFEILPSLQPGVYVHFHDVFYPFDYPLDWVEEGRGWNEAYVLRAFLEYNDAFEIVLWNDLIAQRFPDRLARDFPLWTRNTGGSLWLRRRG